MIKHSLTTLLLIVHCVCFGQKVTVNNKAVFQSSLVKPVKTFKLGDGRYIFDFGSDAFGTLSLMLKLPQADSIIVHLGEKLNSDGAVDRKPGGSIKYQKMVLRGLPANQPYLIKLPANKRNTNPPAIALPDSFGVVMPFRYCEIENVKIPVSGLTVRQKIFNYHFNDNASFFTSSDSVLNKIWTMCKQTIKATSFTGLYIDGDRERTPYEADAYINQLSHYSLENDYSLARRTNQYFINHPTWPTEWILHTVLLYYTDYMYTGNTKPLLQNYDVLRNKSLIQLEREDGLINMAAAPKTEAMLHSLGFKDNRDNIRDIVDWPAFERDGYDMVQINTVVNAFHYINLKLMADIAGILKKKNDSLYFSDRAALVKTTINQKLFNKEKGVYVDGEGSSHSSLHANMFPLAFGLVPKEYVKPVTDFIKSRGMACSVYGAQYLLEGLYKHGEADYGMQLMTAKNDRSWWNMIKAGSTMTLEAWDIKYKPNLDWNHAWGTAPANIITRYVWGVTPAEPGFTKVNIKPQLQPLTFSKIKVPTINGTIYADYTFISKQKEKYLIKLPKSMNGAFTLPAKTGVSRVLFNKRWYTSVNNILKLQNGLNRIEIYYQ